MSSQSSESGQEPPFHLEYTHDVETGDDSTSSTSRPAETSRSSTRSSTPSSFPDNEFRESTNNDFFPEGEGNGNGINSLEVHRHQLEKGVQHRRSLVDNFSKKRKEIERLMELVGCHPILEKLRARLGLDLDAYTLYDKARNSEKDPEEDCKSVALLLECIKKLLEEIDPTKKSQQKKRTDRRKPEVVLLNALTLLAKRLRIVRKLNSESHSDEIFKCCVQCTPSWVLCGGIDEAALYYGASLISGGGGLERSIPKGIEYLHRAAFSGLGLMAYFVLGWIYEQGVCDNDQGIDQNLSRASHFYHLAAENGYVDKDWKVAMDWKPEFSIVRPFLRTPQWHTMSHERSTVIGERFNWALAAQAFLIGAACVLSGNVQPEHFPTLLVIVPVLGIVLGSYSLIQIKETIARNDIRGRTLDEMIDFKLKAYKRILERVGGPFCEYCGGVGQCWHKWGLKCFIEHMVPERAQLLRRICTALVFAMYVPFAALRRLLRRWMRWLQDARAETSLEKERARYGQINDTVQGLRRLSPRVEKRSLFFTRLFLLGWFILLVNELGSLYHDGGNWWNSTIRGSPAVCNLAKKTAPCTADSNRMTVSIDYMPTIQTDMNVTAMCQIDDLHCPEFPEFNITTCPDVVCYEDCPASGEGSTSSHGGDFP